MLVYQNFGNNEDNGNHDEVVCCVHLLLSTTHGQKAKKNSCSLELLI